MLNTITVAAHTSPVVFSVAFEHFLRKLRKLRDGEPTESASDDVFFDEAFHIVKTFIAFATQNTLEELQSFTNTHVPNPLGCAVHALQIPMESCNAAAKLLIDVLGEDIHVVGGSKWWQVRGMDGLDAEWLATKDDQKQQSKRRAKKESGELEEYPDAFDDLHRVMLYIHGGGYSWGSVNTHRYQVARYARKLHGRVFSVNYRKAPGYPWPCPLQDALAAYLYLTDPPAGAAHKAVPPGHIVFGGDSAGAGICAALLTIIRDLKMELPAGAVLISPWVDLSHSMPSVMDNTKTDIIPQYGFVHKPSPLWGDDFDEPSGLEVAEKDRDASATSNTLAVELDAGKAAIRGQIQQYATNRQLLHPLVSPLLSGSLGNLCPLYIVVGDKEVLRDEGVYLAHRAADPAKFPLRDELLQTQHQKYQAETFTEATQVHLQVLDDFCHVPTVFSFTPAARYVYQSAGEFARHVIDEGHSSDPFPPAHSAAEVEEAHEQAQPSSQDEIDIQTAHTPDGQADGYPPQPIHRHSSGAEVRVKPEEDDLHSPSLAAKHLKVKHEPNMEEQVAQEVERRPNIVRERIDFSARIRSVEDDSEFPVLEMSREDIGIIKTAPVQRWLTGQALCKKKFCKTLVDVMKRRRKCENQVAALLVKSQQLGILSEDGTPVVFGERKEARVTMFDLEDDRPPPSAIAGRHDNPDSIKLLKAELRRCVLSAPDDIRSKAWDIIPTSRFIPKKFPQQPASEQQTSPTKLPTHGLSMWMSLMSYFLSMNIRRARRARDKILQVTGADTLLSRIHTESHDDSGAESEPEHT
ncbi:alpha/beta-hydrolase [Exidia glandulosa HHB12029]|uniref:Alpha/beta-hydrolase n=1 Tax=Exidia glandulosa HHB12029 TaxID=1314781 RepID=A0A165IHK9_EXIGL|nr:alpha/beta-hydrolase [Exidia glandulosa HHB12029]